MADIVHHFPIKASADQVFQAISTPTGLDTWWTNRASGEPKEGAKYELSFGPDGDWRAIVSRCVPQSEFELELIEADSDWLGTRLQFLLEEKDGATHVRFRHTGWPEANEHYEVSCYCWAMYLRLLRRYVETGEVVPYEKRLDV